MGADEVERLGAEDKSQDGTQHGEEEHDREAKHPCLTTVLALVVTVVHKEVDRHRYHREDTWGEHGEDATAYGQQKDNQQVLPLVCSFRISSFLLSNRYLGFFYHILHRGSHSRLYLLCRFNHLCHSSLHIETEVMVFRGYAAAVVAELITDHSFDGEVFLADTLDFLSEHHGTAERLDHTLEDVIHLLVGFRFPHLADALIVGTVVKGEHNGQRPIGVGVLRIEVPAGVEFGGEDKFGFGGRGLVDLVGPLHRV